MQFNTGKFLVLRYQHTKLNYMRIEYTGPRGVATPKSKSVRGLVIDMSDDASFQ